MNKDVYSAVQHMRIKIFCCMQHSDKEVKECADNDNST